MEIWRQLPLKHTGFKKKKLGNEKTVNVMQKSTCKYSTFTIYRHVACRAVTIVLTMGTGWGRRREPSCPKHRTCSGVLGVKMLIDSSVGQH